MKKMLALALLATSIPVMPAWADELEFDPGTGWITINGGVGQGRSAYFTCDEAITLSAAAFFCDMSPGEYEVVIYEGAGEFAPPGPILATARGNAGGTGLTWQEIPISFALDAGRDYILHFRSTILNGTVANAYQRFFWGDQPGQDRDLGVVTIRDGREGYDALNFSNVAFPRLRITFDSGACYPDCDTSTGVGVLDIFDFLCFQNRYDAGSPYACDCDTSTGPGVCDIFDFLCFQNAYDAGCP